MILKKIVILIAFAFIIPTLSFYIAEAIRPRPEYPHDTAVYEDSEGVYRWENSRKELTEEEVTTYTRERDREVEAWKSQEHSAMQLKFYTAFITSLVCIAISLIISNSIISSGLLLGGVVNMLSNVFTYEASPPFIYIIFLLIMLVLVLRIASSFSKKT